MVTYFDRKSFVVLFFMIEKIYMHINSSYLDKINTK